MLSDDACITIVYILDHIQQWMHEAAQAENLIGADDDANLTVELTQRMTYFERIEQLMKMAMQKPLTGSERNAVIQGFRLKVKEGT